MHLVGNKVHPTFQMLFNNNAIFQDDNSPIHIARSVQSCFEEHEDVLQHLPWPAKSPHLNTTGLWSVLESRLRSRLPHSSFTQLADVLHEQWYSIPLQNIQKLYQSIPRRIQAVLHANGGPTPY